MALKDLQKAENSLFVVLIISICVLGAGLLLYMTDTEEGTPPKANISDSSILTGEITELVEDCVRSERLEDGKIVSADAVVCDGGSSIVVGEQRIQTSAGFVAASEYFSVDISELSVGDIVEVRFNERSPGIYDIDCDDCAIREL